MRCRDPTRFLQVVLVVLVAEVPSAWAAPPCTGVDRSLTTQQKAVLAPEIANQLQVTAEVLQSFRSNGWGIFYVGTHDADDTYLFYSGDPLRNRYVALWSGAARNDEEQIIEAWTLKNAPGIPLKLAVCFARHVAKER